MMMSQLTHFAAGNVDPTVRRVMVLHQQGLEWRSVLMSREDKNGGIRAEAYQSFAVDASDDLLRVIEESEAEVVVRLLPGGTVVCRTVTVPRMEDESLGEVLDLQAEAILPAGTEGHRRAVCLLPWIDRRDDEYEAIALSWPGREPDDDIDLLLGEQSLRYAPLVSCFIEILAAGDKTELSTSAFVGYLDRGTGTFDFLIRHHNQSVFRTLRFDSGDSDWIDQLEGDLVETTVSAGMNPAELESWRRQVRQGATQSGPSFIVDEHLHRVMISIWSDDIDIQDNSLWNQFAPSILAGCGLMGPRQPLFQLLALPPEEKHNPIVEWLHWFDHPARAASILVIAVLLIALVPLGAAWGRYQILQSRIGDSDTVAKQAQRSRDEAQFYELLNKKRWPMTKLLADISGSAPYPVKIQEITIDSESGQVRLKGTAPVADDLSVFREVLGTTGIFDQIRVPRSETKANFVQFEMSFGVSDPTRPVKRAFTDSLAHNLYGDDADKVKPGEYEINIPTTRSALGGGNRRRGQFDSARNTNTTKPSTNNTLLTMPQGGATIVLPDASNAATEQLSSNIPAPLTQEQIQSMTYQQALDHALKRTKFLYDSHTDIQTKTRLKKEFDWLTERTKETGPKAKKK